MQKLSVESLREYLAYIEQGDAFLQGMHMLLNQGDAQLNADFFAQLDLLIEQAQNDSEKQVLLKMRQKLLELQEQERLAREQEEIELQQLESDFDIL